MDFPRLMTEGRFPAGERLKFSFVFLDFTSTCGEQLFSHTESKVAASTPGRSLRRFRKDNNHLEKSDAY